MKNLLPKFIAIFPLFSCVQAVIVAGARGGVNNTNNTTQAQLATAVGAFPAFDNVVRYSDASGVYLGYDQTTKEVYVLTARHINPQVSTITVDGLAYSGGVGTNVGGDLTLVKFASRLDLQVPNLPSITLDSSSPTVGSQVVMIGYGVNRTENASTGASTPDDTLRGDGTRGYTWGSTANSLKRWGTNNVDLFPTNTFPNTTGNVVETVNLGAYTSALFTTDFDRPTNNWITSNEAIGALGDSGGGVFTFEGGQWKLSGVFTAVANNFTGTGNTAAYGGSYITNVASYITPLNAAIGVNLIPEPMSVSLMVITSIIGLTRRRRSA
jgi:hypothetical protein